MSKIFVFILISLFFTSCSLNKNSKLWNKEDQIVNEVKDQKEIIFVEEKKELKELNPLLQLDLSKTKTNNKIYDDLNKILGSDGIKRLTDDTQGLMKQQMQLAESMKGMEPLVEQMMPMINQMKGMMNSLDSDNSLGGVMDIAKKLSGTKESS